MDKPESVMMIKFGANGWPTIHQFKVRKEDGRLIDSNGLRLHEGKVQTYYTNGVERARWVTVATLGVQNREGELWLAAPEQPIDEQLFIAALHYAHERGQADYAGRARASFEELNRELILVAD